MGGWMSRTRAWVYIAFYDEYVGRHINTSTGLAIFFMAPLYLYGIQVNRLGEQNSNAMLYNWQYFDKRNRLCHNMIMEHFEVHKEQLEDLIVDLHKNGPAVFHGIQEPTDAVQITLDDFALIDELSGLNLFLDNFMRTHNLPETTKEKIRARMVRYSGDKPKNVAINELRNKILGNGR